MKETIQAFAKENITDEKIKIELCPSEISEMIEPDSIRQGTVSFSFDTDRRIKGCIFSTNRRMLLEKGQFYTRTAEISYTFHGMGMLEGDIIQGDFIILSEVGEYRIPYTITAQQNIITSSQGKIRNVEAFASLANVDKDEAYRVFVKHRFINTLKKDDPRYLTLYTGLVREGFSMEAMEEFLSSTKAYDLAKRTDKDNRTVQAKNRMDLSGNRERLLEKDRIVCLYELFLDFRCMKTTPRAWLIKTRALLTEQMEMNKGTEFYKLYYIHTLIIEKKYNEARSNLEEMEDLASGNTRNRQFYAYYLYLCSLIGESDNYIELCCDKVWKIYKTRSRDPYILWMLFMMEKKFLTEYQLKAKYAEELYNRGVISPIILMEIALLYRRDPSLCQGLSDFNSSVLLFAARQNLLTDKLFAIIYDGALRSRDYSKKVYFLLCKCYELNSDKKSLQTICQYLIINNKSDNKYFKWFELGVQNDLRIARLYDYYLYSVEENMLTPLPEKVLQYFRYNMDIEYNKKSFLFANLYEFRTELPEMYAEYKEDMLGFVRQQLEAGRINRHLASLYTALVDETWITRENARQMTDLLFSCHLETVPVWADGVIVTDPMLVDEKVVPIIRGQAVVYIYSDDAFILFKDGDRKRFVKEIGELKKWFYKDELMKVCEAFCPDHPGILLKRCKRLQECREENWYNSLIEILDYDKITDSGKEKILQSMLNRFYNNKDYESLTQMLEIRDSYPKYLKTGEHHLSIFLLTGRYYEAFDYAKTYGCEHLDARELVSMCEITIMKKQNEYDEGLYNLVAEVFERGKYSENMLKYLICYAKGPNEFLKKLINAGENFGIEVIALEEQLIVQALFARQLTMDIYNIFYDYNKHGQNAILKKAVLTYVSYKTVTENLIMDDEIFKLIDERISFDSTVNLVCKIAWLYKIAGGCSTEESKLSAVLEDFEQKNLVFGFYELLPKSVKEKYFYNDKIILQCKAEPGKTLYCHFSTSDDEDDAFVKKQMNEVYRGIYTFEYRIFSLETLYYYITVDDREDTEIKQSGMITKPMLSKLPKNRYEWIDYMLSEMDYDRKDSTAVDFIREDTLSKKLFPIP